MIFHKYDNGTLSLLCVTMRVFKLDAYANDLLQTWHWNALSPVCITMCVFRLLACVNDFSQIWHWKLERYLSLVCHTMPVFRLHACANDFSQTVQPIYNERPRDPKNVPAIDDRPCRHKVVIMVVIYGSNKQGKNALQRNKIHSVIVIILYRCCLNVWHWRSTIYVLLQASK